MKLAAAVFSIALAGFALPALAQDATAPAPAAPAAAEPAAAEPAAEPAEAGEAHFPIRKPELQSWSFAGPFGKYDTASSSAAIRSTRKSAPPATR